jgi:hypothetical protein
MKKETKIFVTCLVIGMWLLNLSIVNLMKAGITDPFHAIVSLLGVVTASTLFYLSLKD